MKWLLASVLIVAGCVATFVWLRGGPRVEVAKDKLMNKIDSLLGQTEVQRKEVELAIKKMDKAIDELSTGRIRATVKAEQLQAQTKETEAKIADIDETLPKLKEHLLSGSSVEIGGVLRTPEQIKTMADKLLAARTSFKTQVDTMNKTRDRLDAIAKSLGEREANAKERLVNLNDQLKAIDTELVAVRALKEASSIAGDDDKTLGGNFDELEKKVTDLRTKVSTETRMEEEKWKTHEAKSQDARKDLDSVDSIIAATKTSGNTLTEIDKALGDGKVTPKK